jgi:DNA-binding NarL/FixJ family response regulator
MTDHHHPSKAGMKAIKVFLVDDHPIVREGFRSLLSREDDIEVVGEASGGQEAIDTIPSLHVDIVVMDVQMAPMNGFVAAERLLRKHPGIKVLILSMHEDSLSVGKAVQLGVSGYLVKSAVSTELLVAIREIFRGNAYFSPSIQKILVNLNQGRRRRTVDLTIRDRELLELIGRGKTNKEIAASLGIGIKSVEKYRQLLIDKLDIHDVAGLTRYAIEHGILKI